MTTELVLGIDVSACQPEGFDWRGAATDDGIKFAVCKAGEGTMGDRLFPDHVKNARDHGIITGSYWVLDPYKDGVVQANAYYAAAQGRTEMPPAMDFELPFYLEEAAKIGHAKILQNAERFVEQSEANWGKPILVYTFPNFFECVIGDPDSEILSRCPLWMASYPADRAAATLDKLEHEEPKWLPMPWRSRGLSWRITQFDGDKGRKLKSGRDVDFNYMRSAEDLDALCAETLLTC